MLETYKLAIRIMDMFADLDPWENLEDEFEANLKWTAEMLLSDDRNEIIDQLEMAEVEPDDWLYPKYSKLIEDIKAYEIPVLWFRETGKPEVA